MARRDELENNDTTEEEERWQYVGCLFCLHRLTVRREGGGAVFYHLFNQCFPPKLYPEIPPTNSGLKTDLVEFGVKSSYIKQPQKLIWRLIYAF